MKVRLALLFFFGGSLSLWAQRVNNVRFQTIGQDVYVTYDLAAPDLPGHVYDAQLLLELNGKKAVPLIGVKGDMGTVRPGKDKRMVWAASNVTGEAVFVVRVNMERSVSADFPPIPQMKYIAGGSFDMGNNQGGEEEKPRHSVKVSSFELGTYEVSNREFCAFLNARGNAGSAGKTWYNPKGGFGSERARIRQKGKTWEVESGYENNPVIYVSWYGAKAYVGWLNQVSGMQGWRLPSEAEWEYAAGGGLEERKADGALQYSYTGSNQLDAVAWHRANSQQKTHPVGQKSPNLLGLYDMSGNVWEWCEDGWHENYQGAPRDGSAWTTGTSSGRILRGGSWYGFAEDCRVTVRYESNSADMDYDFGFRVARTP
jgi:sulfatase modifying factor 1